MRIPFDVATYRDRAVLPPSKWGRIYWNYLFQLAVLRLHSVRLHNAPSHVAWKKHIREFCFLIPCRECRVFFGRYMKHNPLQPDTNMFTWVYNLKKAVNAKLHKPNITLPEARAEQSHIAPHHAMYKYLAYVRKSLPRPRRLITGTPSKRTSKSFKQVLTLLHSHLRFIADLNWYPTTSMSPVVP